MSIKLIKEKLISDIKTCSSLHELNSIFQNVNKSIYTIPSILGRYTIQGNNQDENQTPYSGFLDITSLPDGRLKAVWTIGETQYQVGTGFNNENILVFNFRYEGEGEFLGKQFKGVVVYTISPDGNLKGFWSEKYGDQRFLGKEIGKKIHPFPNTLFMN